jgi:hypothetical protein
MQGKKVDDEFVILALGGGSDSSSESFATSKRLSLFQRGFNFRCCAEWLLVNDHTQDINSDG